MSVQKTIRADRTTPEGASPPARAEIARTPPKLRNPDLAEPGPPGPGRALHPGEAGPGAGASTATNGHWLHDDLGPTGYIAPQADALPGSPLSAPQIIERIEERLGYMAGLDASRIHVSVAEGRVTLSGLVDSAEARRRAGSCAVAAAEGAAAGAARVVG